jgi:adenine nucleotide transporter 17
MLFQKSSIMRTIYKLHIQKTLYKGSTPIALTLALSNFIFFYTLQTLKKALNQDRASFLTSTIAGVVNVLITNPFWVANLRLVQGESSNRNGNRNGDGSSSHNSISSDGNNIDSDDKKGIVDCFREIYEKEGLAQLWAGTGASLLLVSNPAIQYYCYESVKMELLKQRLHVSGAVPSLRPLEAFVIAALAKGLATVLTYPLQLSQLLMRLQKKERQMQLEGRGSSDNDGANENVSPIRPDEKATGASAGGGGINRSQMAHQERQRDSDGRVYKGLFHCMTTLYKDGGMRALYSGMDAKLIQSVLTSALTFLTYEQILGVVARSYWSVSKRLSIGHTSF